MHTKNMFQLRLFIKNQIIDFLDWYEKYDGDKSLNSKDIVEIWENSDDETI